MEKKIQTTASLITHSFSAHLDEVLLSNGKVGKRIRIDHPEAAAVVPFLSEDDVEISSLEVLHLDEVRELIGKGLILDGKTLIGLCLSGLLSQH
ncbi:MAG: hypothetical protein JRJ51_12440 [Deltaproteobacteria bacterium]|nr:hypothetical protein [Deltaproteobacteria bacterium]